jgi:hypothetical protein
VAVSEVKNLLAIELGNEPECEHDPTQTHRLKLTCIIQTTPRTASPSPAAPGTPQSTPPPK